MSELPRLLADLAPTLDGCDYLFVTLPADAPVPPFDDTILMLFREAEGLTVVLPREVAIGRGLGDGPVFRRLVLGVPSALDAVGLTAAVSRALADADIPANVVAAYHHDHVFVPAAAAAPALAVLERLSRRGGS